MLFFIIYTVQKRHLLSSTLDTPMLSSIPVQAAHRKFNSRSVLPAPLLNKKEASFTLKAIGTVLVVPTLLLSLPPPQTLTALLPNFSSRSPKRLDEMTSKLHAVTSTTVYLQHY